MDLLAYLTPWLLVGAFIGFTVLLVVIVVNGVNDFNRQFSVLWKENNENDI